MADGLTVHIDATSSIKKDYLSRRRHYITPWYSKTWFASLQCYIHLNSVSYSVWPTLGSVVSTIKSDVFTITVSGSMSDPSDFNSFCSHSSKKFNTLHMIRVFLLNILERKWSTCGKFLLWCASQGRCTSHNFSSLMHEHLFRRCCKNLQRVHQQWMQWNCYVQQLKVMVLVYLVSKTTLRNGNRPGVLAHMKKKD